ncbi:MAG: hypothetical protein ACPL09_03270 [Candidatus Methanodesulfokora sp.]
MERRIRRMVSLPLLLALLIYLLLIVILINVSKPDKKTLKVVALAFLLLMAFPRQLGIFSLILAVLLAEAFLDH